MAKRLLAAEEKHTEQEIQFLLPLGMTAPEALWNEFDSSYHLPRARPLMIIIVFLEQKWVNICRHKSDCSEMKKTTVLNKQRIKEASFSWFAFTSLALFVQMAHALTQPCQLNFKTCALYIYEWMDNVILIWFNIL